MACRSCDGESDTTFMGAPWCCQCVDAFLKAPHRIKKILSCVQTQSEMRGQLQERIERGFQPLQKVHRTGSLEFYG